MSSSALWGALSYGYDKLTAAVSAVNGGKEYLRAKIGNKHIKHREDKLFLTLDPVSSIFAFAIAGVSQEPKIKLERTIHLMEPISAEEGIERSKVDLGFGFEQYQRRDLRGDCSEDLDYFTWAIPHVNRLYPCDSKNKELNDLMTRFWKHVSKGIDFMVQHCYEDKQPAVDRLKNLCKFVPGTLDYKLQQEQERRRSVSHQVPQLPQRIQEILERAQRELLGTSVTTSKASRGVQVSVPPKGESVPTPSVDLIEFSNIHQASGKPGKKKNKSEKTAEMSTLTPEVSTALVDDMTAAAVTKSDPWGLVVPFSPDMVRSFDTVEVYESAFDTKRPVESSEDRAFAKECAAYLGRICQNAAIPEWTNSLSQKLKEIWTVREFEEKVRSLDVISGKTAPALREAKLTEIHSLKGRLITNAEQYSQYASLEFTRFRDS